MDEEVKIGDIVILKNTNNHFSDAPGYNSYITFSAIDIESELLIHDIIEVTSNYNYRLRLMGDLDIKLAYKVFCNKGFTYLRRNAFELKLKPEIKEDYNYLTDFFTKYNIL
jgi:hypothetical protein